MDICRWYMASYIVSRKKRGEVVEEREKFFVAGQQPSHSKPLLAPPQRGMKRYLDVPKTIILYPGRQESNRNNRSKGSVSQMGLENFQREVDLLFYGFFRYIQSLGNFPV